MIVPLRMWIIIGPASLTKENEISTTYLPQHSAVDAVELIGILNGEVKTASTPYDLASGDRPILK